MINYSLRGTRSRLQFESGLTKYELKFRRNSSSSRSFVQRDIIVIMFKAAPRLSNLIVLRTLSKGNSRLGPVVHGPSEQLRTKATSTSLDLAADNAVAAQAIDVDVYSEQDLLKRAKFRHTGKEVQQKIASEVSYSENSLFAPTPPHSPACHLAAATFLGITLLLIFTQAKSEAFQFRN